MKKKTKQNIHVIIYLIQNCSNEFIGKYSKPAISSIPMYDVDELNGIDLLTKLTIWSNNRMYMALANASSASCASWNFNGTLR